MAKILVVDDEYGIAEVLAAVLEDEGYEVALAINGHMALASIENDVPDLIFTDYMMPLMDGRALVRAIMAKPDLRHIPIVVMSSMPEATIQANVVGHAQFVRKPFRLDDVVNAAARLLSPESR